MYNIKIGENIVWIPTSKSVKVVNNMDSEMSLMKLPVMKFSANSVKVWAAQPIRRWLVAFGAISCPSGRIYRQNSGAPAIAHAY